MSCNRENVIWKDRTGKWSIGFFDFHQNGDDPEWDVEYDHSSFNFASVGHDSAESAYAAWRGTNPGGSVICTEPTAETDRYDEMAAKYIAAERALRASSRRMGM
jgi:hypothetical protein